MKQSTQYTPEQRAAYRQDKQRQAREQVERSVRELLTSDGWRRWAETRATFHDYSFGNCLLIAHQRPDASRVAGFRKWQELGRQVRKGERAIRIMAPMVVGGSKDERRDVRSAGQAMSATSAEKMGTADGPRVLFRAVPVFDVSQTDGDPLPEPPREPLTGDSHAPYIGKLEAFASSIGVRVEREPLEHAGGYYSDKDKRIVIDAGVTCPNAHVRTLVHELAHAVGVPTYAEHGRAAAEVIVETAGAIVCGSLGLDTSGEAIPYIATWGESGDLEAIRKHAETVDAIARDLERACGL